MEQKQNKMEPIQGKTKISDPSHRYNMEKLIFQRERTKTCITNLQAIASNLKIPSYDLIVVYLKNRLSTSVVDRDSKIIITNDVDIKTIQAALYEFIEHFVLCKRCRLPELKYDIKKKQLETTCESCGRVDTIITNQYTDKVVKKFETHLKAKKGKNRV